MVDKVPALTEPTSLWEKKRIILDFVVREGFSGGDI